MAKLNVQSAGPLPVFVPHVDVVCGIDCVVAFDSQIHCRNVVSGCGPAKTGATVENSISATRKMDTQALLISSTSCKFFLYVLD